MGSFYFIVNNLPQRMASTHLLFTSRKRNFTLWIQPVSQEKVAEIQAAPIILLFCKSNKNQATCCYHLWCNFFHMASTRTCREFNQVVDTSTSSESNRVRVWKAHLRTFKNQSTSFSGPKQPSEKFRTLVLLRQ